MVGWRPDARWAVFIFGLFHGLGLATKLQELALPANGLVANLLSFNLGVEAGQLAFIAATIPCIAWLRKSKHERRIVTALCVTLVLFGTAWFVDRALNLGAMPF